MNYVFFGREERGEIEGTGRGKGWMCTIKVGRQGACILDSTIQGRGWWWHW